MVLSPGRAADEETKSAETASAAEVRRIILGSNARHLREKRNGGAEETGAVGGTSATTTTTTGRDVCKPRKRERKRIAKKEAAADHVYFLTTSVSA